MSSPDIRRWQIAAWVCAAIAGSAQAAESYPSRPIRLIVGYAPGGGADIMARLLAQRLPEGLGQPVVVENRPGAGQNIGAELVARSPADGYTLLMSSSALGINVSLYPKLGYHPVESFAPIAVFAQSPNLLLVHPSLPPKTAVEFIAFVKRKGISLNYSSSGSGSTQHLSGELFRLMTGAQVTHVAYKGSAPSLTALVGGEVEFAFNNIPSAQPFLQQKRLKVLGITSAKRSGRLPEVPTLIESGLKGFDVAAWYGVLAPRGTPPEIVARLNRQIVAAAEAREFRDQLVQLGADPDRQSPEHFARFLAEEIQRWREVIRVSNAKPE